MGDRRNVCSQGWTGGNALSEGTLTSDSTVCYVGNAPVKFSCVT